MESRVRILFLTTAVLLSSGCAATKDLFGLGDDEAAPRTAEPPGQVIDPEVVRREIKEPAIDRENFEVGGYVGVMSVEDFQSNILYGARLAYHLTEGFFVEGTIGQTDAGETSYELLSGGAQLLSASERQLTYYNLSVGYNVLPGEGFVGDSRAYNTSLYIVAGLGTTQFAGDDRFSVNFGAGYRFLLTDSVALHIDFRDLLFDMDLFGEEKTAHNLEATVGVTVFF
ncbi:MAG TPA: outer membrane beta-barrel domain-containing protein [Woeseiaceae bacterium]|nr:outer membrane beta-barrel domain-containing protein [Woeseiaceae bacterium]